MRLGCSLGRCGDAETSGARSPSCSRLACVMLFTFAALGVDIGNAVVTSNGHPDSG